MGLLRPAAQRSGLLLSRRWLAAAPSSSAAATEMGTVLDRFKRANSYIEGFKSFSASTLAVVQLRQVCKVGVHDCEVAQPCPRDELWRKTHSVSPVSRRVTPT